MDCCELGAVICAGCTFFVLVLHQVAFFFIGLAMFITGMLEPAGSFGNVTLVSVGVIWMLYGFLGILCCPPSGSLQYSSNRSDEVERGSIDTVVEEEEK